MFTEIFGASPRVKLLDFLADHLDFDYTLSQMQRFTMISRPTLYRLVPELEREGLIIFTREVGGSRFYRMNVKDPRVASMLRMEFSRINEELMKGRYDDAAAHPGMAERAVRKATRKPRPLQSRSNM